MEQRKLFLTTSIRDGFKLLKSARLRFCPKGDDHDDVLGAWLLLLIQKTNWNGKQDRKRIAETFAFIATNDHDFPTIARFLELLPPRVVVPPLMIGRDEISEAQRLKNLSEVRGIIQGLKAAKSMPKGFDAAYGEAKLQEAISINQNKR